MTVRLVLCYGRRRSGHEWDQTAFVLNDHLKPYVVYPDIPDYGPFVAPQLKQPWSTNTQHTRKLMR